MADHHLHLWPHRDRPDEPVPEGFPLDRFEQYVEAAAGRGVSELGFTEHLYRCVESAPVLGDFWEREPRTDLADHTRRFVEVDRVLSLDDYVAGVLRAREAGLPVALGLEIDFFPETIDAVIDLLAPYPWDFLIGSVHWVGGWAIDSQDTTHEFGRRGIEQAWADYFEIETALAASGAVDVLAHVDVCKKYGFRPEVEPVEAYRKVVEAALASGTAVEVSSQGLRNPVAEVYPSPVFLEMFSAEGVPITLASDGHEPGQAAWGHAEVVAAARGAGYTERVRFERRRRSVVPL